MDATTLLKIEIKHDLNFTVPAADMEKFINSDPENRERLANFLDKLADGCRTGTYPFTQTAQEAHGPVDFM